MALREWALRTLVGALPPDTGREETTIHRDGQDIQDKGTAGVLQTLNVSASDSLLDASICEPGKKLSQSSGTDAGSAEEEKAVVEEEKQFTGMDRMGRMEEGKYEKRNTRSGVV